MMHVLEAAESSADEMWVAQCQIEPRPSTMGDLVAEDAPKLQLRLVRYLSRLRSGCSMQ